MKKTVPGFILLCLVVLQSSGCASTSMVSQHQLEGVRKAVEKVLPTGAQVGVTTRRHVFSKPDVIISAHLLEGHSADEDNPYVRGDYGTHEKLTRLVRLRSMQILRSIVEERQIHDAGNFIIQARHGVRVSRIYGGSPSTTSDKPMTIYVVKMAVVKMVDPQWSRLTDKQVMEHWKVQLNIIPSLHFQTTHF